MTTALSSIASLATGLSLADLPPSVVAETRRMMLDMIGCIIAAKATPVGPVAGAIAEGMGHSPAAPALIGDAYLNARLGDAMDFEEGCAGAHFGCGAVGAALAVGRHRPVSGADALLAVTLGYELGARISAAVGSYYVADETGRQDFADVWGIATPVVMASAGAGARLFGLDASQSAQAYAHALSNAPVPIGAKWNLAIDLPDTKYCDTGWCAVTGLGGVLAAQAGSTALPDLLDGEEGFYRMVSAPNARPARLTEGWGENWAIGGIVYKEWPCCGMLLPPMINLLDCMAEHAITADEIEAIHVTAGAAATSARFVNQSPRTFASRQFSFPHAIAMLCLGVPAGAGWLSDESDADPRLRDLRSRVTVSEHDASEIGGRVLPPRRRPSSVTVRTKRRVFTKATDLDALVPARHEVRWTDVQAVAKFRALVEPQDAEAIIDMMLGIEALATLKPLVEAIDRARPIRHHWASSSPAQAAGNRFAS